MVPGPDFAVDADLADTPRNQLGVLRAEVEDEDLVAMDIGHGGEVWVRDKLECALPSSRREPEVLYNSETGHPVRVKRCEALKKVLCASHVRLTEFRLSPE